jgi:ribosomal-protein-alanine N-acetyltransferase
MMMAMASQAPTAAQWPREHFEQAIQISQPRRVMLVLEDQTAILAFLVARAVANEWELENIAVAHDARRRGIGSRILSEFLDMAQQQKAEAIFLEVRESNHAAFAFYQKWAFEEVGRRTNYYTGPKEDALVYRLTLS